MPTSRDIMSQHHKNKSPGEECWQCYCQLAVCKEFYVYTKFQSCSYETVLHLNILVGIEERIAIEAFYGALATSFCKEPSPESSSSPSQQAHNLSSMPRLSGISGRQKMLSTGTDEQMTSKIKFHTKLRHVKATVPTSDPDKVQFYDVQRIDLLWQRSCLERLEELRRYKTYET
jgi:hypothetical protein